MTVYAISEYLCRFAFTPAEEMTAFETADQCRISAENTALQNLLNVSASHDKLAIIAISARNCTGVQEGRTE